MKKSELLLHIKTFENAIKTFNECFGKTKLNSLERDGAIQRFEYTFELSWKTTKRLFDYYQIEYENYPRNILKTAYKIWVIKNIDLWFDLLDTRNELSHKYDQDEVDEIFKKIITPNRNSFEQLLKDLNNYIKKHDD